MSKKTSGVVGVLLLSLMGSVAAGGWWLDQQAAQLTQVHQQQQQITLQVADLNDRLVASVRQNPPTIAEDLPAAAAASSELMRHVVRQALVLAQTALQHDQPDVALDLLLQTERRLKGVEGSTLAPALVSGLQQRIQTDIVHLQQMGDRHQQARHSMDVALSRLQRVLAETAQQGPALVPTVQTNEQVFAERPAPPSLWQRMTHMVHIEPAQAGLQASIAVRALTCHQVALTLGMARTALQQQQTDQALALIHDAQQQLHPLPDADARQIDRLLQQLLVMPMPKPVLLESLALLPEQSA